MGLKRSFVQPAIAVSDLTRARDFYERKLGLTDLLEEPGGIHYRCAGGTRLFLYESPRTAGRAEHTVAGWYVDDLPTLMRELKAQGVAFEHYTAGTPTDAEGVFQTKRFRAAWVRDPDGNTLAFQEWFADAGPSNREDSGSPVVHVEVRGPDPDLLRTFYQKLAGWTFDSDAQASTVAAEVSEPGRYGFVDRISAPDGSGVPAGIGGGPDHTPYAIFYLGVPDVAVALQRAEEHGGRREMGPLRVAGRDLVVGHVRDPLGNLIGLAGPAGD